jgi:hypothetical protein
MSPKSQFSKYFKFLSDRLKIEGSNVLTTDVSASNGVIHVLENVVELDRDDIKNVVELNRDEIKNGAQYLETNGISLTAKI